MTSRKRAIKEEVEMEINLKFKEAEDLIDRHYKRHVERIQHGEQQSYFSLNFFLHHYQIVLMKQIQGIFNIDDEAFEKLTNTAKFYSCITKKLQAIIVRLANMALDAQLYPVKPARKSPRP